MRRKDLLVDKQEDINAIIEECDVLHVGFADGDYPYIVPVNFGYEYENGIGKFYFHSAHEGRKVELCEKLATVGFELDTGFAIHYGCDFLDKNKGELGETPCGYTNAYKSVIGTGTIGELEGNEEKSRGLNIIMRHCTNKGDWEMDPEILKRTKVFCITVEEICGKQHG